MMLANGVESALFQVTRSRRALLLAAAGAALVATPAAAQADGDNVIAEVTITAQKRAENVQDVPLSVAVVQGEALEALKLNEATDIAKVAPSVTFINSAGPRNFGFFVRGIGTSTFAAETIEGSTGYVLDGVVLGQAGSALADLPDIERLEVLRGPQGTLFGKNASAGVINIVTRRPSKELDIRLSGSWAWPDDERKISGYVSGPITDTLRFSLSGRRNKRDGIIDNVFDGRKFNDRNDGGVRGKLEWEPSDDLTATFTADYYRREADCCLWTFAQIGGAPSAQEALAAAAGIVAGTGNFKQNINGDVFANGKNYGASLQVDYELGGGFTLTSISAYRRWFTKDGLDSDSSPLDNLDVNFAFLKQSQVSQELRVASPTGGFVDYVAGLYYFETDVHSASTQLFATVPLPFFSRLAVIDAQTRNIAAFGQANINVSDSFRLIAGARVLNEKVEADKNRLDVRFGGRDSATASKSDDAVVWRLGAQYDVTDDVMAFATVTRGYKGGGYDTNIGVGTLRDVRPEKPTSYEFGVRSRWPDLRLVANATVFFGKVKDYQSAGRDPVTATYPIANGEAKTRGVEFEVIARPFDDIDFTLRAGGAYVDAEWGDFPNAPCFGGQTLAEGCIGGVQQDLTGARLPFSPMWQGNIAGHYETPVANDWRLTVDANLSFRSDALIAFPNNPRTEQDGYSIFDMAVGVGPQDGRWKASVFAKNLFDQDYRAAMFSTPFGNARSLSQFQVYESQRVVGVALDLDF
ncbi:TonB-dependent receptor [Phenylobacterium sp.]|uniref:TonB-dependent receptor n=1 Tax=Phenylobacterium sp. TaxID=1871053 RepID=UPI0025D15BA7|nr:TonB-dependent receptor [Phenylobacterium sp.]MBX3484326.1 TonB-dependent receptor [Phenylobacterium sp.]MCW5759157.1 TonB-dependent receptor [Phenylobacterium sp.]